MMPGSNRVGFGRTGGEYIDMPRGDLQDVTMMVKQLRVATVEYDMDRGAKTSPLTGHRLGLLQMRLVHS